MPLRRRRLILSKRIMHKVLYACTVFRLLRRGLSAMLSSESCLVSQAFCTICGERIHPLQRLSPIYPSSIAPCARGICVNSGDGEEAAEEREFFTCFDFPDFSIEFGIDEACSKS
jgi:hypothetical protein